jgi:hypothetical protein
MAWRKFLDTFAAKEEIEPHPRDSRVQNLFEYFSAGWAAKQADMITNGAEPQRSGVAGAQMQACGRDTGSRQTLDDGELTAAEVAILGYLRNQYDCYKFWVKAGPGGRGWLPTDEPKIREHEAIMHWLKSKLQRYDPGSSYE